MKKHLFLDLEETLIDSIEKQQLLQGEVLKVKNFIKHHQIKEFGIFSFAIDTALEMVDACEFSASYRYISIEKAIQHLDTANTMYPERNYEICPIYSEVF